MLIFNGEQNSERNYKENGKGKWREKREKREERRKRGEREERGER